MPGSFPLASAFASTLSLCLAVASSAADNADGRRDVHRLESGWTLRTDDSSFPAGPGDSWEPALGDDFDGIAEYVIRLPRRPAADDRGRLLLEIDGAATAAEVRLDGQLLGRHLGGWTPFRVDLTDRLDRDRRLTIRVDEQVGHNTQGFLPIVVPHFGGIWKQVRLIRTRGPIYLDDLTLRLSGFDGSDQITADAMVRGSGDVNLADFEFGWRIVGPEPDVVTDWRWQPIGETITADPPAAAGTDRVLGSFRGSLRPPVVRRWGPASPHRYQMELAIRNRQDGTIVDRLERPAAIRHFQTRGRELRVNGNPVHVRGLLNWGYAPPRLAPAIDRQSMRQELQFARDRGFNLMKFCLWVPPREYLDLADEMGVLTWVEYPTWHPDFSQSKAAELEEEFREFFFYDRNAASVLLRSLTCETGHNASEAVIRRLYDLGHALIPGAIIEDDSSWISWQRVHDFYDDHPYGNNHTWLSKLDELDAYIAAREAKPLVLGEAIAADTWEPAGLGASRRNSARDRSDEADSDEAQGTSVADAAGGTHRSLSAGDQPRFRGELLRSHGLDRIGLVRDDSYRVALATRKYQMEAFRYRLPSAGYVVSVLRDFPLASMGLIDRAGRAKWSPEDFDWHGPTQLVLDRGRAVRSIRGGEPWRAALHVVSETPIGPDAVIRWRWSPADGGDVLERETALLADDSARRFAECLLPVAAVSKPVRYRLTAVLAGGDETGAVNAWDLWVVPDAPSRDRPPAAPGTDDPGLRDGGVRQADLVAAPIGVDVSVSDRDLADWGLTADEVRRPVGPGDRRILTRRLTPELMDRVEAGARCLLIADGSPGSIAVRDHWFLRGGPVVADHPLTRRLDRQMLADLQTFDLAGPVMFEFPLSKQVRPLVSLWDNHDLDHYRSHGLVWEAGLGRGRLVASSLNHRGRQGPAGPYVLRQILEYLAEPSPQTPGLTEETVRRIRDEMGRKERSLVDADWRFRRASDADLKGETTTTDWIRESTGDPPWQPIEITRHWDAQGHADWDGWGFYRTRVTIPDAWIDAEAAGNGSVYLTFTGVDDYMDVFVDGVFIGSGGDLQRRETAFELRTSFPLPDDSVRRGEIEIAVRVFDWYGAGGIFRPVSLTTRPIRPGTPILVPLDASPAP